MSRWEALVWWDGQETGADCSPIPALMVYPAFNDSQLDLSCRAECPQQCSGTRRTRTHTSTSTWPATLQL